MTRARVIGRAAASLWLAAALLACSAAPVEAALRGRTGPSGTTAVTSGSWRVDARLNATDAWTGSPLTVTGVSTKHILYFSFVNFGSMDIVGATLTVSISKGNNQSVSAQLHTCTGTWDEVADTCSTGTGGIGTLLTVPWPSLTAAVTMSIPAGGTIRIQVDSTLPGTQATISVAVSSNAPRQIRAATTTSS